MKKILFLLFIPVILFAQGQNKAVYMRDTTATITTHTQLTDSMALVLRKANNLSDLPNKTTSRTNLGVYSTGAVDTYLGAKTDTTDFNAHRDSTEKHFLQSDISIAISQVIGQADTNTAHLNSINALIDTTQQHRTELNSLFTENDVQDDSLAVKMNRSEVYSANLTQDSLDVKMNRSEVYSANLTQDSLDVKLNRSEATTLLGTKQDTTYLSGLTSRVQTQLNSKVAYSDSGTTFLSPTDGKGLISDSLVWIKNGNNFYPKSASYNWGSSANRWNLIFADSITANHFAGGTGTFTSTIGATTGLFSNLTNGYIPYHVSDASGLANSNIYYDGTNVGIGTTNPTQKLVVVGSVFSENVLKVGYGGTATLISYLGANGDIGVAGGIGSYETTLSAVYSGSGLALATANAARFYIANDGNVGIGTTAPKHLLSSYKATPVWALSNTTINTNVSTAAQAIDTTAIVLTTTATESSLGMKNATGTGFTLSTVAGGGAGFGGNLSVGGNATITGNLKVQSDSTTHDIFVGNATYSYMDAGAGWTTSSDSTLKENITELSSILDDKTIAQKILNTDLYRYNFTKEALGWKDISEMPDEILKEDSVSIMIDSVFTYKDTSYYVPNPEKIKQLAVNEKAVLQSAKKHFGFIAQNFGEVWEGNPDNKQINWQKVSVIEWYAIQELIKEVISLKADVKAIKTKLGM